MTCVCAFDPHEDPPHEESYHYKRTCVCCHTVWWGLHCRHDGVQNPCPGCGITPDLRPTPLEALYGVRS